MPSSFKFLNGKGYVAIICHDTDGDKTWTVELKQSTTKRLFKAKDFSKELKSQVELLKTENNNLKNELKANEAVISELNTYIMRLEHNNSTILENEKYDGANNGNHTPRGRLKSSVLKLEEQGADLSKIGFQGGSVGLGKNKS